MTQTAHTPGPWRVGPVDDTRVEDANGNEVAQIDGDYNQPETWPMMEANARLIAAAPDLMEALEDCVDRFVAAFPAAEAYEPIKNARAAIAKAKGEQA